MEEKKDYAETLNLLKTNFKMKAGLPNKEPLLLRDWQKNKIYETNNDFSDLFLYFSYSCTFTSD